MLQIHDIHILDVWLLNQYKFTNYLLITKLELIINKVITSKGNAAKLKLYFYRIFHNKVRVVDMHQQQKEANMLILCIKIMSICM